jgi:hypothetical protein
MKLPNSKYFSIKNTSIPDTPITGNALYHP